MKTLLNIIVLNIVALLAYEVALVVIGTVVGSLCMHFGAGMNAVGFSMVIILAIVRIGLFFVLGLVIGKIFYFRPIFYSIVFGLMLSILLGALDTTFSLWHSPRGKPWTVTYGGLAFTLGVPVLQTGITVVGGLIRSKKVSTSNPPLT